jgi:Domain of Unknown Function (DUF1080)
MKSRHLLIAALFVSLIPPLCHAAEVFEAVADPAEAVKDPDFAIQGEYAGEVNGEKFGVQVIALGDGKFTAVVSKGGLPGDGWDGEKPRDSADGQRDENGVVTFTKDDLTGVLKDGLITVTSRAEPSLTATLSRVERDSPTAGAAPPEGAILLFDGTADSTAKYWETAKFDGDLLTQGALSKEVFKDFTLHIEFRLPWMPKARGQGRGNSGLYLTGRYEVQMLDSFGLPGVDNECGGIYKVAEPKQNLCYPPLRWQTYDVDFTSAKFDGGGNKTTPARVTVRHNGYVIHENLEVPGPTGGARSKDENGPGPIFLQDHGNPVRYRNIWVLPK